MDWDDLRVFLAVARGESLSAAGRGLKIDPATVGRGPKKRVQDLPAGGTRLMMPPLGVHGVWVNGARVADENGVRRLDRLPGKVLRDFLS